MASHNDFGNKAEEKAKQFLEKKGYKILARNFRYQKAEIDIIAEVENYIVIIEVKARSTDIFNLPQEAVTKKKIQLLVKAANYFMEENKYEKEVRFDIISVLIHHNEMQITHLEYAFESIDSI